MYANAEIRVSVSEAMECAALTGPNAYWHHAPGLLAYYGLPGDTTARDTLRYGIETAKRLGDCGAEAVVSASDMADNSGPFFNSTCCHI